MTRRAITGATRVAGVVGSPVRHSLSPLIHNAWLEAGGVDGVYVAFPVAEDGFGRFVAGLRGGVVRGLNVTVPFKEEALGLADSATDRARAARAANVLVFGDDGAIHGDNTDGEGMFGAFARQAPGLDLRGQRVLLLGAGGAARGAVAALEAAGAGNVRILNRTDAKAEALAAAHGASVQAAPSSRADEAFASSDVIINATSAGLAGAVLDYPLHLAPPTAVVMDMTYKPLRSPLLEQARSLGLATVDGLEMLICQAIPSFEAFFGAPPSATVDVRALAEAALAE